MNKFIDKTLSVLERQDNLRLLKETFSDGKIVDCDGVPYLNMSSNDYLGLSADLGLQQRFFAEVIHSGRFMMSNSASRLMSGNSEDYMALEQMLSELYVDKTVLVLGSGYAVNVGVLPAIVSKDDLIIADKLVHASLIDGLRLSGCKWERFRHNDMNHLEELLKRADMAGHQRVWVVTESIFSMDGDRAPLQELVELRERYGFGLYLDEAHAFGVEGKRGGGYAAALGLDAQVDMIVGTFGKAMASYGAFIALDGQTREMLVNRMRPLIFSTALPPINLLWTKFLIGYLPELEDRREVLRGYVRQLSPDNPQASHIVPIMAHENSRALELAQRFKEHGYWVTAIRYPTVPKGEARVRVSLSSALSQSDVDNFVKVWKTIG